jgi:hypothetical protein
MIRGTTGAQPLCFIFMRANAGGEWEWSCASPDHDDGGYRVMDEVSVLPLAGSM